jgi:hypothetical protein
MIEECGLSDSRRLSLASGAAVASRHTTYPLPSSTLAAPAEILDFRPRAPVQPFDAATEDRSISVVPDQQWRRRIAGLQNLGQQRKTRTLRVMWPANDRGRKSSTDIKSTLPLHILTGAVVAFAGGLFVAGAASFAAYPEFLPSFTAWVN